MDNSGTPEVVDLIRHWHGSVPADGFEWVSGQAVLPMDAELPDLFLIKRPGADRSVVWPDDLWLRFHQLNAEPAELLTFANRYGWLHQSGTHFHRADGAPAKGERLSYWSSELRQFQALVDVWYAADTGDAKFVRDYCKLEPPSGPHRPNHVVFGPPARGVPKDKPLLLGKYVVVENTNRYLGTNLTLGEPCRIPGCKYQSMPDPWSTTQAEVIISRLGQPDLIVRSTDLLTTIWLQFASWITGRRRIKKCETCGTYMDVTDSPRPNARRMHPRCEERIRKARYRGKIAQARQLATQGKTAREIASLLETELRTVKGWLK